MVPTALNRSAAAKMSVKPRWPRNPVSVVIDSGAKHLLEFDQPGSRIFNSTRGQLLAWLIHECEFVMSVYPVYAAGILRHLAVLSSIFVTCRKVLTGSASPETTYVRMVGWCPRESLFYGSRPR